MSIFKQLLQISWRNIFRNKRRTLLTLFILILGCTGLLLVGGFFDYIIIGFGEYYIRSQTGHFQVNASGYFEKGASDPLKYLIQDVKKVEGIIKSDPHVTSVIPRLRLEGMASGGKSNLAVIAFGVEPDSEKKMAIYQYRNRNSENPSTRIVEGDDLDPSDAYGVIVGKGLLKALGLEIGDNLTFLITREAGAIDGAEFRIRGIFETPFKDFDDRAMKVNLKTAQNLLATPDQVHSILVILDVTNNTDIVRDHLEILIKKSTHPLEIISWKEQAKAYDQVKEFFRKIYATVQLIIGIIFLISIANTINMNLFERVREFGTMMAIGNSRSVVFIMISIEAMILGLLGASLGIGVGVILAKIISAIGIQMPPPPMGSYGYVVGIYVHPQLFLSIFLIGFFSTTFASLFPGYRASHMKIVEALGHV